MMSPEPADMRPEPVLNCSARWRLLRADRAWSPPTSSSLRDEEACPLTPSQHGGARSGLLLTPLAEAQ
jgi:hypothetical protein